MNNKKTPEEIENMGLREFILFVDFMGTKEFCDWQKIPPPHFTGDVKTSADLFLQVDAIKHRLFVERAKKDRGDGEWVREKDANDTFSKLNNELGEIAEEIVAVKEKAIEALKPFGELAEQCLHHSLYDKDQIIYSYNNANITMEDLRRVEKSLKEFRTK